MWGYLLFTTAITSSVAIGNRRREQGRERGHFILELMSTGVMGNIVPWYDNNDCSCTVVISIVVYSSPKGKN